MMGVSNLLVVRRGVPVVECAGDLTSNARALVLEASDKGLDLVSDKTLGTLLDPLKSSASDPTIGVHE